MDQVSSLRISGLTLVLEHQDSTSHTAQKRKKKKKTEEKEKFKQTNDGQRPKKNIKSST